MPDEKPQKVYSKSQMQRFALFDLWSAMKASGDLSNTIPFEQFYSDQMDEIFNMIHNRIDSINLGLNNL